MTDSSRLSQQLLREPFGSILEQTMTCYWSGLMRREVEVSWNQSRNDRQKWFGNRYLNFFASDDILPESFDAVIRAHSRDERFWAGPVKRLYVRLAIDERWRRRFASLYFDVSPPVPDVASQILIVGDRRLRLVMPHDDESVVIPKFGYNPVGLEREIKARLGAAAAVAPRLVSVAADGNSFVEEYVACTPADCLEPAARSEAIAQAEEMLVVHVHTPTRATTTAGELARTTVGRIRAALASPFSALDPVHLETINRHVDAILSQVETSFDDIETVEVLSHGDFQDRNFLDSPERLTIVDWKNSIRGSGFSDLATLHSGIRLRADWAAAWEETSAAWLEAGTFPFESRLDDATGIDERRSLCALWALEEAAFRIERATAFRFRGTARTGWRLTQDLQHLRSALARG